tara:strand:+ start:129 stop:320 length:192 start_codon:yes stop_codon:yes gene_type:complete
MTFDDFIPLILGLVAGVFLGAGLIVSGSESHKTIVEKGYGIYCPDNGKFAFTGECSGLQETQL